MSSAAWQPAALLAAVLAFAACWLAPASAVGRIQKRRAAAAQRDRWATRRPLGLVGLVALALAGLAYGWRGLVLASGGLALAAVTRRMRADARRSRDRAARQRAVLQVCDALAAELRAGISTTAAVERAFADWPEWAAIATAARLGGDVPAAIRRASQAAGAQGLRTVAAGWAVAGQSGAALSDVLDRVAAGLRSDDEARSEVTAALGPPRATAKMLAVLPVFGLLLGTSMGAKPLDFLLFTTVGELSLAMGTLLAVLGVFWVERLAAAVEEL